MKKKKTKAKSALALRRASGNGPPPEVRLGFGSLVPIVLIAVGASVLGVALYVGDALSFFAVMAVAAYLRYCYVSIHAGSFGLLLANGALTGVVLEHGGHFVWRSFQSLDVRDGEESNLDVEFRGICADNVEAWGVLSVPSRESYQITDKEGGHRATKVAKAEYDERTKAFALRFSLWLLSGLTTEQYIRHQAGFAFAVSRALCWGSFPDELTRELENLGQGRLSEWPLVIVRHFDAEAASDAMAMATGVSPARRATKARLSFSPVEVHNGREIREGGIALTEASYDKTKKEAQAALAAAPSVAQEFAVLAAALAPHQPKNLVAAVLAAMGKGSYQAVDYGGLAGVKTFITGPGSGSPGQGKGGTA